MDKLADYTWRKGYVGAHNDSQPGGQFFARGAHFAAHMIVEFMRENMDARHATLDEVADMIEAGQWKEMIED